MSTLSLALDERDVQRIADAVAAKVLARSLAMTQPANLPARLTVREAAAELRCSDRQVRRLVSLGRLRAVKLGHGGSSRQMIARADVERLREGGV